MNGLIKYAASWDKFYSGYSNMLDKGSDFFKGPQNSLSDGHLERAGKTVGRFFTGILGQGVESAKDFRDGRIMSGIGNGAGAVLTAATLGTGGTAIRGATLGAKAVGAAAAKPVGSMLTKTVNRGGLPVSFAGMLGGSPGNVPQPPRIGAPANNNLMTF